MKEYQSESRQKQLILLALAGLLIVGLIGVGLALATRAFAQGEPTTIPGDPAAEGEPVVREDVAHIVAEGGVLVTSNARIGGMGFPFEAALHKLVAEGVLTEEVVDSIMTDLSDLTDAVTYNSTTGPNGQGRQITLDINIRHDDETLRPAMEQALNNAVAAGSLTAEQAAAVLAEVDAAPNPAELALAGGVYHTMAIGSAMDFDALMAGPLRDRLDHAVAEGTITADEAQTFQDILAKLLAPAE